MKKIITEGDWEQWKNDVIIDFSRDNHFTELKESDILKERVQTLDMLSQYVGEYFTKEWVMKTVLKLDAEEIKILSKDVEDSNSQDAEEVEKNLPNDE